MLKTLAPALCLLVLLASTWGCAPPGLRLAGRWDRLEPDRIVDLKTGRDLSLPELVDRLARARVVFLGELHNHPAQHRHQLEIVEGLWSRDPALVLGLEVFARTDQPLLDRWVGGRIDESVFLEQVAGPKMNRSIFEVYLPLLQWARRTRTPLLALNAPRSVTAKVAAEGLAALPEADRSLVARDIRVGPPAYRDRITRAFGFHEARGGLERFFEAQVVWDETMAETLSEYLASPAGRDRRAVVICGNEHVMFGYGVPDRVGRRLDPARASVLMLVPEDDERLTTEAADFVWVTPPAPPPRRPRLGVALKADPSGRPMVAAVSPGSEAERIGLAPGDVLIEMDGRPLTSLMDMHRAASEDGKDREHDLTVDRNGEKRAFRFRFRRD
ncbi:MAG: ChaN family lipoprotein [Proteobacteria bacterium]|nr:ChaN family lipoprotein [Pseudomonadota bacterium]